MATVNPDDIRVEKVQAEQVTDGGKRPRKVVTHAVRKPKRGVGTKLAETFLTPDMADMGETIMRDIIAPGLKSFVYEALNAVLYTTFWNQMPPGDRRYSSYDRMYAPSPGDPPWRSNKQQRGRDQRRPHDFSKLWMQTREDAELVLDECQRFIAEYGSVSVADFLTFMGEDATFTDEAWGWTDMRSARVQRGRYGWEFRLPPTRYLNN